MGLATCWIGPGADHESITLKLGQRFDKERDHIICVCAVGHLVTSKTLSRTEVSIVVHSNCYLAHHTTCALPNALNAPAVPRCNAGAILCNSSSSPKHLRSPWISRSSFMCGCGS